MFLLTLFSTLQNSKIFKYKSTFYCRNVYHTLSLILPFCFRHNKNANYVQKFGKGNQAEPLINKVSLQPGNSIPQFSHSSILLVLELKFLEWS